MEPSNIDPAMYQFGNNSQTSFYNGFDLNNLSIDEIGTIAKQISVETHTTTEKILEMFGEKIETMIPYPDIDEIPEVTIKDEDTFTSGGKIKFYKDFHDKKFNICKKCENENNVFCKNCKINLCYNCSKKCKKEDHDLIDLYSEEKYSLIEKAKINQIIKKFLEEDNGKIPGENSILNFYTNDIKFIMIIMTKNYKNYFNYKNIKEGREYLEKIYDNYNNNRCLKIKYCFKKPKSKKGKKIKIFGSTFVKNNEDNLYLTINNKRSSLVSHTIIYDKDLEVILVQKSKNFIKNISCMFNGCKSTLIEFSEVDNYELLNLSEVTDISYIFKDCTNLEKIDLSFLNSMNKIKNIDSIFYNCKNLALISKIESLHTKYITNMDSVFNNCMKLKSLKKFNFSAEGVESFNNLFHNCSSLKTLPNISGWDMKNAKTLKGMFSGCGNLESLPDISNWNLENVVNMEEMFAGCRIKKPPDFTKCKWDLKNLKYLDKIFYNSFATKINFENWKIGNLEIVLKNNIFNDNDVEDDDEDELENENENNEE